MPRTDCPEHGVLRIAVPWARPDSGFTLLFEQAALALMREMPVAAAARIIGVTDQRLWRILRFYVGRAIERLDLSEVEAVALDETAAKRGHSYVTVFIDLDAAERPVLFVTPGKGKECMTAFRAFLAEHGGEPGRIAEVVCDMSAAFLAAAAENFPQATVTVDWFHVVQIFTTAVEQVRRAEAHQHTMPKGVRWATLKRPENLTAAQQQALDELETGGFATAEAYRAKEMLRWVRQAATPQAARWRLTNFLNHVTARLDEADRHARPRPPGRRNRAAQCQPDHPPLALRPLQCPPRSAQWAVPGSERTRPRLSQHRYLRVHHLPDRSAHRRHARCLPFHLRRLDVPRGAGWVADLQGYVEGAAHGDPHVRGRL